MTRIQRITLLRCGAGCAAILCAGALGCASFPKHMLEMSPAMMENRERQTRRYDTGDEGRMLSACAALLQDTGFTVEESDASVGLITASKTREASVETKEASKLAAFMLLGLALGDPSLLFAPMARTTDLTVHAVVTTQPIAGNRVAVRVLFRRTLLNSEQQVNAIEMQTEPELYQEFFSGLSKAVFLEEQEQ